MSTVDGPTIRLPASVLEAVRAQAAGAYPAECCGALFGRAAGAARDVVAAVAVENVAGSARRYRIPAPSVRRLEAEAARRGLEVVGFYHSHPDAVPAPSSADREAAWPWYSYLIVAVEGGRAGAVRSWRLRDDRAGFEAQRIVAGDEEAR